MPPASPVLAPPAGATGTTFADALRDAVRASGLGLESIRRRLAARDVDVSVATLSYWQSGTRAPGRKRSEEVVAHLESVLGLSPRSLRVLIPAPRPRGPVPAAELPDLPRKFAECEAIRAVAERVQHCRGGLLTRISQQDVLTIGEDRRVVSLRSRSVVRADVPGIDSIGLTQFFEDTGAGCPLLRVVSGGAVRAAYSSREHRVLSTEVHFGHELERGETLLLEFEVTSDGPGPADRAYDSSCGVGVRELSVQVRFRTDDLPVWCETYQSVAEHGPDTTRRRVPLDPLGHAHTVVLGCPPATIGLAWDWTS